MFVAKILMAWLGVTAIAAGAVLTQDALVDDCEAEEAASHVPAAVAEDASESSPDQVVTVNEAGLFDAYLRDVPLQEAMRLLSLQARRNISVSGSVTAAVTADLYQLTFEEALEALLTPGGYAWFPRGKFVYVCTPQEQATVRNAGRQRELRIFELDFIAAADGLPVDASGTRISSDISVTFSNGVTLTVRAGSGLSEVSWP